MRYIVITLILANALYFGWRFLSPPIAVPVVKTASVDKSQIQLVDDNDEPVDAAAATHADSAAGKPNTELNSSVMTEKSETAADVAAEPTTEQPAADPVLATTPVVATPAVTPSPLQCVMTPWTRDEKQIKQWQMGFAENTIETLTQEVETQRRFLVYIPAKSTAEKTLERLREIKKLPIESAHINKGEYIGGISLGLFSQLESAQGVLKQAHDLGINDAKQTVRVLTATEYRLRRQTSEPFTEPWTLCVTP